MRIGLSTYRSFTLAALVLVVCRALEDIIDPFYGEHVPRQQGGFWRHSFRDLGQQQSRSAMRIPARFFVVRSLIQSATLDTEVVVVVVVVVVVLLLLL